ncbi:heme ABC transporter ATP-binding protein [Sneathiella glossodoripedis]|uniref:heme ABC transporter ATP-binding protein n=1 Tax=Sneathiella glossodoripedis TaxID=418853 RepID=UPI000470FBD4|nr:heme ABC transporter ATP-binding protein [Sneathiella glossodoripedis]
MISAQNLSFKSGKTEILQNITVKAEAGEILGILGPNGAGKSTLLKCLAGFQAPTSGDIYFNHLRLKDYSLKELAKLRAVLTQQITFNFPFKVHEIASMGRNGPDSFHSTHDQKIVDAALKLTQTHLLRDRQISSLSGGEQQRVHLARVLAQIWESDNALLLLDEPTSALDLKHQFMLFDICRALTIKKNYTIIVVLHDLQLARQVCDRVLLLQNGSVFNEGLASEIMSPHIISNLYDVEPERIKL